MLGRTAWQASKLSKPNEETYASRRLAGMYAMKSITSTNIAPEVVNDGIWNK